MNPNKNLVVTDDAKAKRNCVKVPLAVLGSMTLESHLNINAHSAEVCGVMQMWIFPCINVLREVRELARSTNHCAKRDINKTTFQ